MNIKTKKLKITRFYDPTKEIGVTRSKEDPYALCDSFGVSKFNYWLHYDNSIIEGFPYSWSIFGNNGGVYYDNEKDMLDALHLYHNKLVNSSIEEEDLEEAIIIFRKNKVISFLKTNKIEYRIDGLHLNVYVDDAEDVFELEVLAHHRNTLNVIKSFIENN